MNSALLSADEVRGVPRARGRWLLLGAGPVLFAAIALALGKKTGWDLHNYHWYNPYSLLADRFGFDVAVGHNATYYSPLADIPLYLIGLHFPAWFVGVFLGAMAGVAISLIGVVAYLSLPVRDERARLTTAAALALFGAFGAGAFQEIGDPANDVPAAIGIFAALALLLSRLHATSARQLLAAGLFTGAAVALKLTIAVYAVGIAAALFFAGEVGFSRIKRTAVFGAGAFAGLLIVGGHWMWTMWDHSGNPFFPYFNDVFQSPLLLDTGYLDRNFKPPHWMAWVFFPFYFTADSHFVSESGFRDAHILAIYLLIPVSLTVALIHRRRHSSVLAESIAAPTRFLFMFAAASYLAWLLIFDIYRYLIPLEMVAPLLIALCVQLWPIGEQLRVGVVALLLAGLQLLVDIDVSDRQTWNGPYVDVHMPATPIPDNAMVLMTGREPMSYVIPSFPYPVPFLRIDGWLVQASDSTTGLAREMRARVAKHMGPLFVLYAPLELEMQRAALAHYGLEADASRCASITSNISISLSLCPVSARSDAKLQPNLNEVATPAR